MPSYLEEAYANSLGMGSKARDLVASFGISDIALYIGVGCFLFALLLLLTNIKLDLSWLDIRSKRSKVLDTSAVFWAPSTKASSLTVPLNIAPQGFHDEAYSMNVDVRLDDTRNYGATEAPYRQVVHRGSNELASGPLPPFGLPKRLNPGLFLDPNTNDLLVFVDTTYGSETLRESLRVADIPMGVPFRVGVVINHRVLEVYLNCKLEATKILTGIPKRVENEWYGLAGAAHAQGLVQNLTVWKTALSATDLRALCSGAFTMVGLADPACTGTKPTVGSLLKEAKTALTSLGDGVQDAVGKLVN
jgi:hypothetical protein